MSIKYSLKKTMEKSGNSKMMNLKSNTENSSPNKRKTTTRFCIIKLTMDLKKV